MPNITNLTSTIESRANNMATTLRRLKEKHGFKKCHLVAHSFTGIDARAAVGMFGADELVESVTTICTPN